MPCCEISSSDLSAVRPSARLRAGMAAAAGPPGRALCAGGGADSVARVLAQKLGDALGQRFIVENKTGASGMIGAQAVAKGDADGQTFLVASPAEVASTRTFSRTSPTIRSPISRPSPCWRGRRWCWPRIRRRRLQWVRNWSRWRAPTRSIFVARASAAPITSPASTSTSCTGTRLVHVPYRGAAPAVSDAVGGQVKLTISGMPPVVQFLQAGTFKAIAVTSRQRSPSFPGHAGARRDQGVRGIRLHNWFGLLARTGTPQPILDKIGEGRRCRLEGAPGTGHPQDAGGRAGRQYAGRVQGVHLRRIGASSKRSSEMTGVKVK